MASIAAAPGRWMQRVAGRALLFWHGGEVPNNVHPGMIRRHSSWMALPWVPFWLLSLAGILGAVLASRSWRRFGPAYLSVAVVWATVALFFVAARLRVPAAAVLCLFAASGVVWLAGAIRAGRWRAVSLASIGVASAALLLASAAPELAGGVEQGWARNYFIRFAEEGRHAEALEEFERFAGTELVSPLELAVLCVARYNTGDVDGAGRAILTALSRNRNDENVLATWADFREAVERLPDGERHFRRWRLEFPDVPESGSRDGQP